MLADASQQDSADSNGIDCLKRQIPEQNSQFEATSKGKEEVTLQSNKHQTAKSLLNGEIESNIPKSVDFLPSSTPTTVSDIKPQEEDPKLKSILSVKKKSRASIQIPNGVTLKKLRFTSASKDTEVNTKSKFSAVDGKIYVKSRPREHRASRFIWMRLMLRRVNDIMKSFCCSCGGIPDSEVGGGKLGEPVRFKTADERLIEEWHRMSEKRAKKNGRTKKMNEVQDLNIKEVKQMLKRLNVNVPHTEVVEFIKRYDDDKNGGLNFEEFKMMYSSLQSVPDLRQEFLRAKLRETDDEHIVEKMGITYSMKWQWAKYEYLVPEDLAWFFKWSSNGEDVKTEAECAELISFYSPNKEPETLEEEPKRRPKTASIEGHKKSPLFSLFSSNTSNGSPCVTNIISKTQSSANEEGETVNNPPKSSTSTDASTMNFISEVPSSEKLPTRRSSTLRKAHTASARPQSSSIGSLGESLASKFSRLSPRGTFWKGFPHIHSTREREEPEDDSISKLQMSYESFRAMLTDLRRNNVLDPAKVDGVYQDMTRPLAHYFISASHNSYLLGNQLNSESSPEAVSRILQSGVRVIELDAWDGADGIPIVNHGHTLCKPTSFESCVEAVNQFAFVKSEYPVIVTIENHCSRKQQKKQVSIMKKVFGDKLFLWDILDHLVEKNLGDESEMSEEVLGQIGPPEFLSPEALKGRIVVRDRPVKKMTKREKVDLKEKVKKASINLFTETQDNTILEEEFVHELVEKRQSTSEQDVILKSNSISSNGKANGGAKKAGMFTRTVSKVSVGMKTNGVAKLPTPTRHHSFESQLNSDKDSRKFAKSKSVDANSVYDSDASVASQQRTADLESLKSTESKHLVKSNVKAKPAMKKPKRKNSILRSRTGSFNSQSSNDYDDDIIQRKARVHAESGRVTLEEDANKGVHRNLLRVMYIKNVTIPVRNAQQSQQKSANVDLDNGSYKSNELDSSFRSKSPKESKDALSMISKPLKTANRITKQFSGNKAESTVENDLGKKEKLKKNLKKKFPVTYIEPDFASSSSLQETDMKRLAAPGQYSAALNTYAKTHLIRIYPAGTRINSSNFNPLPAWNAGCQIVALNYQCLKFKVWLNNGKFLLNGGCGYILKPKDMLEAANVGVVYSKNRAERLRKLKPSDPTENDVDSKVKALPNSGKPWTLDLSNFIPQKLEVTVISGHYLPKKSSTLKYKNDTNVTMINPFVELRMRGIGKADFKTKWVESNGFNPRWNESFTFNVLHRELCLLAFIVKSRDKSSDGSFVGQTVLPVEAIRPGYRVVSLCYKNGTFIDTAHLICKFNWI